MNIILSLAIILSTKGLFVPIASAPLYRKCFHSVLGQRSKRAMEPEYEDEASEESDVETDSSVATSPPNPRQTDAQSALSAVTGLTGAILGTARLSSGMAGLIASHVNVPILSAQMQNTNRDPFDREYQSDPSDFSGSLDHLTAAPAKTTRKPRRKKPSKKKIGSGRLRIPSRSFGRG